MSTARCFYLLFHLIHLCVALHYPRSGDVTCSLEGGQCLPSDAYICSPLDAKCDKGYICCEVTTVASSATTVPTIAKVPTSATVPISATVSTSATVPTGATVSTSATGPTSATVPTRVTVPTSATVLTKTTVPAQIRDAHATCSTQTQDLSDPSGTIAVWSEHLYENNLDCRWKITVNSGNKINIKWIDFDLESESRQSGCIWDYVEIYDEETETLLGSRFCGDSMPNDLTSSSNQVLVKFHTDSWVQKQGFSIEYASADCGVAKINDDDLKIVGGKPALANWFPYQVGVFLLIVNKYNECGGSIINKKWILTAAHCFFDRFGNQPTAIEVRYGNIDLSAATIVHATSYTLHRYYKYYARTSANDIALVKLQTDLNFKSDASIQRICLAVDSDIPYGGNAIASGWGDTSYYGTSTNTLMWVFLDIIYMNDCVPLANLPPDNTKVLCALTTLKDTCQGDSGGPLVVSKGDSYVQIGIVSYGEGCAKKNAPGVYTKVSAYRTWIDINIGDKTC